MIIAKSSQDVWRQYQLEEREAAFEQRQLDQLRSIRNPVAGQIAHVEAYNSNRGYTYNGREWVPLRDDR